MTDTSGEWQVPRPNTGEHSIVQPTPQNGTAAFAYLKKWGIIVGLIVGGGAAWQTLRSCALFGAGVVGIQTTEKAKVHEAAAEVYQEENAEAHGNMWQAIERVEEQSQQAADNSAAVVRGMPDSWKRRSRQP